MSDSTEHFPGASGEPEAFRALFEQYKNKVYTIALRYSGDPDEAQDIAQETFLKLFSGIAAWRGDACFDSWLYRVVVNSCLDRKRKTRRLLPLMADLLGALRAPGASALDEVLAAEFSGEVRAAVVRLPPAQRMLVVLRYSESLSYEEIARIFGCPSGTIASRL